MNIEQSENDIVPFEECLNMPVPTECNNKYAQCPTDELMDLSDSFASNLAPIDIHTENLSSLLFPVSTSSCVIDNKVPPAVRNCSGWR